MILQKNGDFKMSIVESAKTGAFIGGAVGTTAGAFAIVPALMIGAFGTMAKLFLARSWGTKADEGKAVEHAGYFFTRAPVILVVGGMLVGTVLGAAIGTAYGIARYRFNISHAQMFNGTMMGIGVLTICIAARNSLSKVPVKIG